MGHGVGLAVGRDVGTAVGVGLAVGDAVGEAVGVAVGTRVGLDVGAGETVGDGRPVLGMVLCSGDLDHGGDTIPREIRCADAIAVVRNRAMMTAIAMRATSVVRFCRAGFGRMGTVFLGGLESDRSRCRAATGTFGHLPSGTRGQYTCISFVTSGVCNHSTVIVDRAELQIGDHDIEDMEKTMCHEVGHSVGLTHGGNTDCMLNGEIPSTSIVWRTYDSHHKSHINAAY